MGKRIALLLLIGLSLATQQAFAQYSSGTVTLGSSGMTVKIETTATTVTLTLTGSSTSYLGIGFGSSGMANGADGFIYNSTSNRDYTFKGVGTTPSADASQDWKESSNTVSSGIRTIVATRTLAGGTGDTPIANAAGTISIFYARGSSTSLAYHAARGYATLTMAGVAAGIDETSTDKGELTISPNPVKSVLSIKNSENIKSLSIFDATGRKLKSIHDNFESIYVSDLKSGIYYIEALLVNGKMSSAKLIKE